MAPNFKFKSQLYLDVVNWSSYILEDVPSLAWPVTKQDIIRVCTLLLIRQVDFF
jgi:hypothetical protein